MKDIGQHPVLTTEHSFSTLGLSEQTLKLVAKLGFINPTQIQAELIPKAIEGRDLIGLAQTGSGKTAAFVIPLAERLMRGKEGIRGLILCPTREIALQTKAFLDYFGKHHKLVTVCLIGGGWMRQQIKDLKNKPDVVVATPGRLNDLINRRCLTLNNISELVFDEADHMMDMGFLPQITEIMRGVPKERHTMMFSATMPSNIERIAKKYLHNPERIDVLPTGRVATGITHRLYLVSAMDKKKLLLALLNQESGSTLVFTRTKMDAHWLLNVLQREGHPVDSMHSDKTQKERVLALEGFRGGTHRILVATDIASRGIDVEGIEHIVNFDIPSTVEEYIHRAGRTARMDAVGCVSTIASWQDLGRVREIEQAVGQKLPRCAVKGVAPYVEVKLKKVGGRVKSKW
ncbi:MAG: DEAD/DEAH box helicase [Deltaproteobacteria bacterium]|nr:DEAD/DEAH box helicase [Deltaproteobacteria bacterium]